METSDNFVLKTFQNLGKVMSLFNHRKLRSAPCCSIQVRRQNTWTIFKAPYFHHLFKLKHNLSEIQFILFLFFYLKNWNFSPDLFFPNSLKQRVYFTPPILEKSLQSVNTYGTHKSHPPRSAINPQPRNFRALLPSEFSSHPPSRAVPSGNAWAPNGRGPRLLRGGAKLICLVWLTQHDATPL